MTSEPPSLRVGRVLRVHGVAGAVRVESLTDFADRFEKGARLDANGRRLTNLVASGEDLVKQAMRNPEFGVGHLEKWAEMLQILKDISANRMPSVADLLKQAAQAPNLAQNGAANKGPMAGQVRASLAGKPSAQGRGSS